MVAEVLLSKRRRREIRGEMKRILTSLDSRWIEAASHEVCLNLSRLVDEEISEDIEHVLAWASFFPGEVDISAFINQQLDKRRIYLPRVLPNNSMSFISIGKDWLNNMEAGNFGIPEPGLSSGEVYDYRWARQTAVITPGLAFDKSGARLGRGGGYYDRFFANEGMMNSIKIGVCWSLQLDQELPVESHDVFMDWICHERSALKTGFSFDEDFDE